LGRQKSILNYEIQGKTKLEKFKMLINWGYPEAHIKKVLKLSDKGFDEHMRNLEDSTTAYLNHLAKIGVVSNLQTTLQSMERDIRIQEGIRDLSVQALEKNHDDAKSIYAAVQCNSVLHKMRKESYELTTKTPLAAAFRQFVKENVIEQGDKKPRAMAVFPPDAGKV